MATGFVTHHDCSRHDPGWGAAEHQGRLPAVARAVYRDMLVLFPELVEVEGVPATPADLALAHDPGYVATVREASARAGAAGRGIALGTGVTVSGASWEAGLAAAGCGLTAVDRVLDGSIANAFCSVRPPGHRVGRAGGEVGLFNTAALAALHLRRRRGVERVLVVDLAARAGTGSAELLAPEPGVRFVATWRRDTDGVPAGESVFPVELEPGAGLADVLRGVRRAIDAATSDGPPGFLLVSLGCDALRSDPAGGLGLEPGDYHDLTRALVAEAARAGGRLVSVLEEGYDAAAMGAAVVQHLRALAGLPRA